MKSRHQAKEQGNPFVIVFVGVNGVGKSTSKYSEGCHDGLLLNDIAMLLRLGQSVLLAHAKQAECDDCGL